MSNKRLYLDIHAIQVLPPSCVNRDDAGTPKSCLYGGKMRARVSSQCWKRAVRKYFMEYVPEMAGVRTKKIVPEIAKKLVERYGFVEDDAITAAKNATVDAGVVSKKGDAKTVLAFFSRAQMEMFTQAIADHKDEALGKSKEKDKNREKAAKKDYKNSLKNAVKENPSSDILLFGRMFASDPSLNYDAACQVAHAISVNEVHTEYDYFTAVDDIPDAESSGSAHIDTKQFNDAVLYRFANVNLSETSELIRLDKEHAAETAREFVRAFICSMPTGSQNGYANATLPDYIMLTLREDMPVSFAPAFIEPVKGINYLSDATGKLTEYALKISANYGKPVYVIKLGDKPFNEILNDICEEIKRRI